MTNISKLTVEEMEAALSLLNARAGEWNRTAISYGMELTRSETIRLMGTPTQEQMRFVDLEVSSALIAILSADEEYNRNMRKHLWLGEQAAYTALLYQRCIGLIPQLVEHTIQALHLRASVVPSESGNGNPKWIQ